MFGSWPFLSAPFCKVLTNVSRSRVRKIPWSSYPTATAPFLRRLTVPQYLLQLGSGSAELLLLLLGRNSHEVIVADPNYAPMYPERRRRVKTDRRDARMLAEAARLGSYRPAHRVSPAQRQVQRQLLVRDLLVRARGRTVALIRTLVRSEGLRVRAGDAARFGTYLEAVDLPAELQATLRPLVALWAQLTDQLATADAAISATAATNPVVRRLTTAPGVGPVIATAFVATLDEAGRFRGAHQVESYLGLVPSEDSSADRHRRGHITKAGNPRMRWLLVQAAWAALRSRRADAADLRAWAHRLAQRRGTRIATVALARRLAGILFAMWRDQSTFVGSHGPVAGSA